MPQGRFLLHRLPYRPGSPLRAWDAADVYVLRHLAETGLGTDRTPGTHGAQPAVWIVNDLFGALAVALHHQRAHDADRTHSWGDSVTSHAATVTNLVRNGLDPGTVVMIPSTDTPPGTADLVVIKIPRSLALLEDQLHRLRARLHEGSVVLGAGMVKTVHSSTLELFERIVGPTVTSRAVSKARLVHATFDPALDPGPNPYPSSWEFEPGRHIIEHANVFSRGRLDQGTRVMLEYLPTAAPGDRVLDLGCGNGLLGLSVATGSAPGSVVFVDESYHAVASARYNAAAWGLDADSVEFRAARDLTTIETGSIDLVVNNPPFHTHQSRTDDIARSMFGDARRVLRPDGGRLVVVGNRHLDHHRVLRRGFASVVVVGSTPKFVVWCALR